MEQRHNEAMLTSAEIPPGYAEWVASGARVLETHDCSVGRIEVFDPSRLARTCYRWPTATPGQVIELLAVELVYRAEALYPSCLTWLPSSRRFAAFDLDHGTAVVSPHSTWREVVDNPSIVDMLWREDGVAFERLRLPELRVTKADGRLEPAYPMCQLDAGPKFGLAPSDHFRPTFFRMSSCDRPIGLADASSVPDSVLLDLQSRKRPVPDWTTPTLELSCGVPTDFLANGSLNLCSARLRETLEGADGSQVEIEWLPCEVVDANDRVHRYWVLHVFGGGEDFQGDILRPTSSSTIVVSPSLAATIATSGCTGTQFNVAVLSL